RAIGDARAVPALIRAIPKTLVPASSDYGLIAPDGALAEFMQTHDLREGQGGQYFDFGRPVREIFGALHKLTGQNFDDSELFALNRSNDPRRQRQQRQLLTQRALRWQAWWEAHCREFTNDPVYQRAHLQVDDQPPGTASIQLGPNARIVGDVDGAV